jgi:hypothetical protein
MPQSNTDLSFIGAGVDLCAGDEPCAGPRTAAPSSGPHGRWLHPQRGAYQSEETKAAKEALHS